MAKEVVLTSRQIQILRLVAKGLENKEIAVNLGLSHWTIRNHLRHLMAVHRCKNRAHLVYIFRDYV